jgi:hypothetical protein
MSGTRINCVKIKILVNFAVGEDDNNQKHQDMKTSFLKLKSLAAVCLIVALLPVFNSCKKEAADVSDLLSKVPSSASVVVGVNLQSLLEKAGCEVNGSEIVAGKDLEEFLDSFKGSSSDNREAMKLFLSGESGIDPAGAIIFSDAYGTYVTAMVADTPKFTEFVKKQTGNDFTEENGVKVCGNVAMAGAQVWVNLTSGNVDSKAIKNYASLEPGQSFITNDFSSNISNMTHDIVGWGKLNAFGRQNMSMGDMAMVNMVVGMLFDGATSSSFYVDFLKGEIKASGAVLNDKGEPAKYLLPAEKVSVAEIKSLGTTAEAVAAMSITKGLVEKIEKLSSSFGGGAGSMLSLVKSLDGTAAVAISNPDDMADGFSAVVTTDGNPSLDLMNLLSQFAPTKKDGKYVRMNKGTLQGGLEVAAASEILKGSTLGVVVNADAPGVEAAKNGVKTVAFCLTPEKGGISLNVMVKGTDDSENILLTLIKKNK